MVWLCCKVADCPEAELEQIYRELSPSRKEHIDRLRRPEDKNRSLAGQWLAGKLLKDQFGISATLCRSPNGQPYFEDCELQVSIAHSEEMIACAINEEKVGIDVEKIRPIDLKICRHTCVEAEKDYLLSGSVQPEGVLCEDPEILSRFFEIWTAKEAYFKKQGTGITDLKSVNILTLQRQVYTKDGYMIQII